MSSIDESLKLKLLKGTPILLEHSNLFFIQRTIGEIIDFGYEKFLKLLGIIFISQEEIEKETQEPDLTPHLYFLAHCSLSHDTPISLLIKEGLQFLSDYEITGVNAEKGCFVGSVKGVADIELSEDGFEELLYFARIAYYGEYEQQNGDKEKLSLQEREMRDKFDKLRKIRNEVKRKGDGKTISFSDLLCGFVSKSQSMSWQDTLNLTHYAFYFLLKKLKQVENYDLHLRALMAGAKSDSDEIPHWLDSDEDK